MTAALRGVFSDEFEAGARPGEHQHDVTDDDDADREVREHRDAPELAEREVAQGIRRLLAEAAGGWPVPRRS